MAATRAATRPAVRLRPVPPLDPPYDDELTLVAWLRSAGDQLELDFESAKGTPDVAGTGYRPPVGRLDAAAESPAQAATASAETRRAARRFLDTCLEILNGYRPLAHARALTTPGLAAGLVEQLRSAADRLPRAAVVRQRQPAAQRLRLLSLRVCEPKAGIAEAAAAIGTPERTWALAFRLERCRGRWIAVLARLV